MFEKKFEKKNIQTTQKIYEKQQKMLRAYIILEYAVLPKMPTQNIFSRWI